MDTKSSISPTSTPAPIPTFYSTTPPSTPSDCVENLHAEDVESLSCTSDSVCSLDFSSENLTDCDYDDDGDFVFEYNTPSKRNSRQSSDFIWNNTWENVGLSHKPAGVFLQDFDRKDEKVILYSAC